MGIVGGTVVECLSTKIRCKIFVDGPSVKI